MRNLTILLLLLACTPTRAVEADEQVTEREPRRGDQADLMARVDTPSDVVAPDPEEMPALSNSLQDDPSDAGPAFLFGPVDTYDNILTACKDKAAIEEVLGNKKWVHGALAYCRYRSWHASRHGKLKNRVGDGTCIHDRDRPTAWLTYRWAVQRGWLDPKNCEHHLTRPEPHPPGCQQLADNWPFNRPRMGHHPKIHGKRHPSTLRQSWLVENDHGPEHFTAQGPIDWNARAYIYFPGCWPLNQVCRNDVAWYLVMLKIKSICTVNSHRRCTRELIREKW